MSKACQAVLEVVHGRYRHIMPATTGRPGHETPGGLHRIEWRWPGWHVSTKYPENGQMLDSQYFGPGIALHGVPSHEGAQAALEPRLCPALSLGRQNPLPRSARRHPGLGDRPIPLPVLGSV